MILSKKYRREVRTVAREQYLTRCASADVPSFRGPSIKEYAIARVKDELSLQTHYSGIVGTLLLALAMRLAEKLIQSWIEDRLFSESDLPINYQRTEPGYE